MALNCSSRLEG
jgi:hypothetical protein